MKIIIKGTDAEIESTKRVLKDTCFFESEFCLEPGCEECENCVKKHKFEIEYIQEINTEE